MGQLEAPAAPNRIGSSAPEAATSTAPRLNLIWPALLIGEAVGQHFEEYPDLGGHLPPMRVERNNLHLGHLGVAQDRHHGARRDQVGDNIPRAAVPPLALGAFMATHCTHQHSRSGAADWFDARRGPGARGGGSAASGMLVLSGSPVAAFSPLGAHRPWRGDRMAATPYDACRDPFGFAPLCADRRQIPPRAIAVGQPLLARHAYTSLVSPRHKA